MVGITGLGLKMEGLQFRFWTLLVRLLWLNPGYDRILPTYKTITKRTSDSHSTLWLEYGDVEILKLHDPKPQHTVAPYTLLQPEHVRVTPKP